MPCRQLIRGHPGFASTASEGLPVDSGLYPYTRTPSPFALFSNRLNINNVKVSLNPGTRDKTRIKSGDTKKCLEQLKIFILPHNSRRVIVPMTSFPNLGSDNNNVSSGTGLLLMLAPRSLIKNENEESSFREILCKSSSPAGRSAESTVPLLPQSYPLLTLTDVTVKIEQQHFSSLLQETNNVAATITKSEEVDTPTTTSFANQQLDLDLLPIKKRRLRQIMMQEQQQQRDLLFGPSSSTCPLSSSASATTTDSFMMGTAISSSLATSSSTSQTRSNNLNNQQQSLSSTMAVSITPTATIPPTETCSPKCASNATTIFLNGCPIPNPTKITTTLQHPPQQQSYRPLPLPLTKPIIRRRPVYIGDRKSVTFIDIESQRWWDRAHLAYAFHPKKRKRKITRKPQQQILPRDIYNPEDPRSQSYQNWLTSFYPERDFSSSSFILSTTGEGEEDEPKSLVEKLGLANPIDFPKPEKYEDQHDDQNQNANNSEDKLPLLGRFPPWVTEEGLKEFDIINLHSELRSHGQHKFHYD